jgi:hypothetical protein
MSTVTFTISGLAVFYRVEGSDSWTIIFPTDECHKASLFVTNKEIGTSVPIADLAETEHFSFTSTQSIPPKDGKFETPDFINEMMDLTGADLFEEGVQKNPNPDHTIGEKRLEIKNAVLFSEKVQENRLNYVFQVDNPDGIKLLKDENGQPRLLTNFVGGSINFEEGGEFTIEVNNQTIKLTDGESFEIDNDCHLLVSDENDYQTYQRYYLSSNVDSARRTLRNGKFRRFETISIFKPTLDLILPTPPNPDSALGITVTPPRVCNPIRISNPKGLS